MPRTTPDMPCWGRMVARAGWTARSEIPAAVKARRRRRMSLRSVGRCGFALDPRVGSLEQMCFDVGVACPPGHEIKVDLQAGLLFAERRRDVDDNRPFAIGPCVAIGTAQELEQPLACLWIHLNSHRAPLGSLCAISYGLSRFRYLREGRPLRPLRSLRGRPHLAGRARI